MVRSIKQLYDKIEIRENKRIQAGKEKTGAHFAFISAFREINEQSDSSYSSYIKERNLFCFGFLYGLCASHFITEEEFKLLNDERASAYSAFLERAEQSIKQSESDKYIDTDTVHDI